VWAKRKEGGPPRPRGSREKKTGRPERKLQKEGVTRGVLLVRGGEKCETGTQLPGGKKKREGQPLGVVPVSPGRSKNFHVLSKASPKKKERKHVSTREEEKGRVYLVDKRGKDGRIALKRGSLDVYDVRKKRGTTRPLRRT